MLALVSLLSLAAFACGGDGDQQSDIPSYVASELQSASPFERTIIADGTVTPPEYERAVLATLSCLDDAGVPHGQPAFDKQRNRWDYSVGPYPANEDDAFDAKYNKCWQDNEEAVAAVWAQQNAPSAKEVQAQQAVILKCLRDHGLTASDYQTFVKTQDQLSLGQLEVADNCKILGYTGVDNFK